MWTLAAILTVLVIVAIDGQTTDYNALCADHTMVLYSGVGPMCSGDSNLFSTGVNQTEKDQIVADHNRYRSRVAQGLETRGNPGSQPPAADMKALVWDDELATVAQRWANQCTYGHDKCRKVERFYVGQNVYRILSSENKATFNWTRTTTKWYDEVDFFNKDNVSPFVFNSSSSHYTALTWANTEFIGCGYTYYKSTLSAEARTPYVKYFVCNYGQGGNYVGGLMYTVGTACSKCPEGKNSCVNSLCA